MAAKLRASSYSFGIASIRLNTSLFELSDRLGLSADQKSRVQQFSSP
jgi:hypothetical protein